MSNDSAKRIGREIKFVRKQVEALTEELELLEKRFDRLTATSEEE